jgi:sugar diacid utilization regulator
LNSELTTKIEQLESKDPSSTTDDSLVKKNKKLLEKMEILSIHNNELTSELENIGSFPGASSIKIPELLKRMLLLLA